MENPEDVPHFLALNAPLDFFFFSLFSQPSVILIDFGYASANCAICFFHLN